MRIGLLQLNATIGAFDKNRARIEEARASLLRLGQGEVDPELLRRALADLGPAGSHSE